MFKFSFYPELSIPINKNPNRIYAFPIFGGLLKGLALIPQFIMLFFLAIGAVVLSVINSFYVLFQGKYWDTNYKYQLRVIRFFLRIGIFWVGLDDKYPGFSLDAKNSFTLEIKKPTNPNRLLAFPVLGGLFRMIILIPYYIYSQILGNGQWIAILAASFGVLFYGKYPQSLYEFIVDAERVSLATGLNMLGFSDNYPSFDISMKHKNVKILLIVLGVLWYINNHDSGSMFRIFSR